MSGTEMGWPLLVLPISIEIFINLNNGKVLVNQSHPTSTLQLKVLWEKKLHSLVSNFKIHKQITMSIVNIFDKFDQHSKDYILVKLFSV